MIRVNHKNGCLSFTACGFDFDVDAVKAIPAWSPKLEKGSDVKSTIYGLLAVALLTGPLAAQATLVKSSTLEGVKIFGTTYNVTFLAGLQCCYNCVAGAYVTAYVWAIDVAACGACGKCRIKRLA
jgi:hypothetical protein